MRKIRYVEMILAFNQGLNNETVETYVRGRTTLREFILQVFAPAYKVAQGQRRVVPPEALV